MRDFERTVHGAGRLIAALVAAGAAALTAACGKSATSPSNATLTPDAATVQAALNTYTTGTIAVPPNCASTVAINCPGGSAGGTSYVGITRSGLTITQAAADSFAYAMDLAVATQSPFTVSSNGVDCAVSVNTAAGTSPTVHLAGTATFTSRTVGGAIDEIDLTTALTGAEAADVSVTGPTACQILQSQASFFEGVMVSALTGGTTRLCAASGGHFTSCS